jgi:hypothetical protein
MFRSMLCLEACFCRSSRSNASASFQDSRSSGSSESLLVRLVLLLCSDSGTLAVGCSGKRCPMVEHRRRYCLFGSTLV